MEKYIPVCNTKRLSDDNASATEGQRKEIHLDLLADQIREVANSSLGEPITEQLKDVVRCEIEQLINLYISCDVLEEQLPIHIYISSDNFCRICRYQIHHTRHDMVDLVIGGPARRDICYNCMDLERAQEDNEDK